LFIQLPSSTQDLQQYIFQLYFKDQCAELIIAAEKTTAQKLNHKQPFKTKANYFLYRKDHSKRIIIKKSMHCSIGIPLLPSQRAYFDLPLIQSESMEYPNQEDEVSSEHETSKTVAYLLKKWLSQI
jgi:hypothetical protein